MTIFNKFIGNVGEKYAEKHLKKSNFSILHTNYSNKNIEIDIIAEKNNELYIFEVKSVSRETSMQNVSQRNENIILNRISNKKIQRMTNFADFYLNENKNYITAYVGIITVLLDQKKKEPTIEIFFV